MPDPFRPHAAALAFCATLLAAVGTLAAVTFQPPRPNRMPALVASAQTGHRVVPVTPPSPKAPGPAVQGTPEAPTPQRGPERVPHVHPGPQGRLPPSAVLEALPPPWDRLVACESGGDRDAYNPAGPYFSFFQWDIQTWRSVGGQGNPTDAGWREQLARARALHAQYGFAPWPVCGRGL